MILDFPLPITINHDIRVTAILKQHVQELLLSEDIPITRHWYMKQNMIALCRYCLCM